ncbi:MAG TPA: hypothetical protein VL096_18365 [Pirellulaceae bacterium]|nr:hypothetical protein [Pirellulaceae bacterium]
MNSMDEKETLVREKYPEVLLYSPTVPRGSERSWAIRKTTHLSGSYLAKLAETPEAAWAMAAEAIRLGQDSE